jgi:type I restriction enzyme S subunit
MSNGTTADQNPDRKGLPVTRIETISTGAINIEKVGWIDATAEDLQKYILEHGDIIFSHINSVERLGNCALYTGTPPLLIHGMNLLRFEIKREIADPLFLLFYLKSKEAQVFYNERARRAIGQASLNTKDLGDLEIPLPPLSEQRRIVAILNEQMVAAAKARKTLEEQLDTINKLPAALLRRAFSGEL